MNTTHVLKTVQDNRFHSCSSRSWWDSAGWLLHVGGQDTATAVVVDAAALVYGSGSIASGMADDRCCGGCDCCGSREEGGIGIPWLQQQHQQCQGSLRRRIFVVFLIMIVAFLYMSCGGADGRGGLGS